MELAIPLVALGGMYVMSNQDKEGEIEAAKQSQTVQGTPVKAENFENMGKPANSLPNTQTPPINYPVVNQKSLNNTVKQYINPNQASDRYLAQQTYENLADQHQNSKAIQEVATLTGSTVSKDKFTHNNMVPFFGGKIRGIHNMQGNESVLDNMQGTGSQQIRKQEQAPMFKPEDNTQWAHGTPSTSDFVQSRMNPSMKISNVKPWKEEQVAPGLGLGYTTGGGAGFNSGTGARDQWMPKSVDELRVANNPKQTFGLANHEGPALAPIKNRGFMGKMEKHLPEKFHCTGPERYLTTVGAEKRETARAEQVDRAVNRPFTNAEYYGNSNGGDLHATYAPREYQDSHKQQLGQQPFSQANAQGRYTPGPNNFGVESYNLLANNRNTVNAPNKMGIVGGAVKAVVAPLLDVLRPSRKENVIGNLRPTGDAGTTVPAAHVFNPADRTRTTIREMTENSKGHLNVENQRGDGYLVTKHQINPNQRMTTNCPEVGNPGNTGVTANSRVYDAEYNMRTNPFREQAAKSRPNQGGTQMYNGYENIHIDKRDADRDNNRMWVADTLPNTGVSAEQYGRQSAPQQLRSDMNCERMNNDILKAFKQNPYTQSLTSAV